MSTNSYGWAAPVYGKGGGGDIGAVTNPNMGAVPPLGDYGGADPNSFNYTPNSQLSNYLSQINNGGWKLNDAGSWAGGDRAALEDYMNNYFTPYTNAQNAAETQRFNESNAMNNFGEQQRVNSNAMNVANLDSARQDLALNYGQNNNVRDFGETMRQFNASNDNQIFSDKTARQGVENQYALGVGQNTNQATDIAHQYALGQSQNANTLLNYNQQYALGQSANANTLLNYKNQYTLGQGQNANQANDIAHQYALGQSANANTLLNYQNQYRLGQGQNNNQAFANTTDRTNVANQYNLGQAANRNQATANANTLTNYNQQYKLGQGQLANDQYNNATNRTNVGNQYALGLGQNNNQSRQIGNEFTLGQGNLSLGNRTLDTTNQFNQQKLGQEASLTREGYQNQLQQAQIQATGRLAGPNVRQLRSWY